MKPNKRFSNLPPEFWASVRLISQEVGYSISGEGSIKVPTSEDIKSALEKIDVDHSAIVGRNNKLTGLGKVLTDYYAYRANTLNRLVEPRLMDAQKARKTFNRLHRTFPLDARFP